MRPRRSKWNLSLRRFGRDKDGAAAVEFAMLAFPFFLIIAAMAEVTIIGFAQSSLDHAVSEASRRIRTGQVQSESKTAADMRSEICNNLTWLLSMDCPAMLVLDVDTYTSFGAVNTNTPQLNAQMPFNPGTASSIVMVRAFIELPLMTPGFSKPFRQPAGWQAPHHDDHAFPQRAFPGAGP